MHLNLKIKHLFELKFRNAFAFSLKNHFCEIMQNFAKRFVKYERKFSRKFTFAGNPTPLSPLLFFLSNLKVLLRGVNFSTNNHKCVENSTVVMVSVKPHLYTTVLEPFKVYFCNFQFSNRVFQ